MFSLQAWRRLGSMGRRLVGNFTSRRLLWGISFYLGILLILGMNLFGDAVELRPGEPSPRDFKARQAVVFESEVLTAAAREEASRQVEPVYKQDPNAKAAVEENVRHLFHRIREAISGSQGNAAQLNSKLEEVFNRPPSQGLVDSLSGMAVSDLADLEEKVLNLVDFRMREAVKKEDLPVLRQKLLEDAQVGIPSRVRPVALAVLQSVELRPTMVYDAVATQLLVERAEEAVAPVQVNVRRGEKILSEGEIVTEVHIEKLQHLGLVRSRSTYLPLLGLALITGVICFVIVYYLYRFKREILNQEPQLVLFGLVIVITLLLARGTLSINFGESRGLDFLSGYLIPCAAGTMIMAILLGVRVGMFISIILSILVSLMVGSELSYGVVAAVGGLVGVYSVSHLSQRRDLIRSSLYVGTANAVAVVGLLLMDGSAPLVTFTGALVGVLNGVLSAVLMIGSLPFLETAFGITSAVRLLELSDPNQPLLRRLMLEAPGTYHHSILVANLAEAAADAVGANSLLARVGAYYHDIGKLKRPYFFIENLLTQENPHDKLTPSLSTLIITSHVKDGLELAQEYKLPQIIIDIIGQHHGSGLISYFYHKALETNRFGEKISEDDFRYETPKPQTREAAIVMLADSVEAGARALQKSTPGRLEALARRVIREKLEDGQLEACDLNFRDLNIIAQAFIRVLSGIFHARVEYPESMVKELERRKNKDAAVRAKPAG